MYKLGNYIPTVEKGANNGVAQLDSNGKLLTSQVTLANVTINTDVIITDSRVTKKGIEYAADYSSDFTARSLVDKAYVDANAGGDSIYTADDTIGAGRVATLTDTITFGVATNNSTTINAVGQLDVKAVWRANKGTLNLQDPSSGFVGVGLSSLTSGYYGGFFYRPSANYLTIGSNVAGVAIEPTANNQAYVFKTSQFLFSEAGIIGNSSKLGSAILEVKGGGTSTGSTLALYDNDTTPYKRFEILDNGQFRLDSSNAVVATPVLIEMRPLGGTGTKPYFKIKNYGEVEILGGLSNLFNVQNTLGAKQFEVLNGTTKINGASQINSTWFQVLTDTQKMSFNAGSGGALHHEIRTNGGGGPITTKFNIPGGGYQFIVGASAIIGTEKISLQGDTLIDGSLDMNNNRITKAVINPSVQEAANAATFTINSDQETDGVLTAMSANTTIAAPTGTPVQSQSLVFRFKDDGSARTLTWNAIFRAIGVTLPTTTTASKLLYVGCKYNSTDTKWDVVSVQEEA